MNLSGYTVGRTLHSGQRTTVCSATCDADGASVVLKYQTAEYPSLAEVLRYRHELDVLQRLSGPLVVRGLKLERAGNRVVLVTEDFGGVRLGEHFRAGPPTLERFLELAIGLVRALAFVHEQGVIHKDINPTNVLVEPRSGAVKLIDFGISTLLSHESPEVKHPDRVAGTFEYMSPEQTGRMNRTQDYRSDYYSLGATLYALAKGEPPFRADDSLKLIHYHIAKEPSPLHAEVPWVPETVSGIVSKLLAKSAEHRYQSARGLLYDLEECLSQLRRDGAITPFPLGARDTSPWFEIPQTLYGRSAEISVLLDAFGRVATGRSELLLVGGYSGIGKSALVNEIHKPIVALRGCFIKGKYDQYNRDVPYSAVTQAFNEMMKYILMEPPGKADKWRSEILAALGPNAQVVIDVVPSLELLLGPQPKVAPLGPTEARHRFDTTFHAFVRVLAQPDHPLVLFLDDLQWADLPSLHLLESLLTSAHTRSLLFIAAYRDNEVDASHPFLLAVQEIKKSSAIVSEIKLGPIALPDVAELVAATVRCSREEALPLAALLHQRTAGNPFFLVQLLRTLHEDGLFTPKVEGGFSWDMRQILALGLTDNVVDLVASRLARLPESTNSLLRLATCIGNQFDLALLARASGRSLQRTAESLWPALSEGLILPLTDDYAAALGAGPAAGAHDDAEAARKVLDARVERAVAAGDLRIVFRFLHDRIQQAAYALLPPDERKAEHLKLGRLLLGDGSSEPPAERLFDIVPHLNLGLDLVTEPAERLRIARLNFRAGHRAKTSAAHRAAVSHYAVAMELLGPGMWSVDYRLALDLHREWAESEYLIGHFDRSDELAAAAIARCATPLDKAAIYSTRVQLYASKGSTCAAAVEIGSEGLALFGVAFPKETGERERALREELAKIERLMAGREIADLFEHPEMTDHGKRAAMDLLIQTWTAAFLTQGATASALLVHLLVSTSLEHGHTAASAFGYLLYGQALASAGDYPRGYRFGQLAMRLNERYPDPEITVRVGNSFAQCLHPYFNPLGASLKFYKTTYQLAPQVGALSYVLWAVLFMMFIRFMKGDRLQEVFDESSKYLGFVAQSSIRDVHLTYVVHRQMVRALQGLTSACGSLDEEGVFSEADALAEHGRNQFHIGKLFHGVFRPGIHVVFNEYRAAARVAAATEELLPFALSLIPVTNHYFYQSLALAALYGEADEAERARSMELMERNLAKLSGWAETGPHNFAHRRDLIAAEIARCRGDHESAARLYDRSLEGAQAAGFTHDEALAAETAAYYYLGRDLTRIARLYMTDACYGYMKWGADAKVAALKERYGHLLLAEYLAGTPARKETTSSSTGRTGATLSNILDFGSMMKAAQAISGEIDKQSLVDQLMRIAIENAGARRGYLVLDGPKGLSVIASASVESRDAICLQPTPLDVAPDLSPAVVRYVVKTREPLVLHDATSEGLFRSDARLNERKCKSIAAVPLLRQGRLTGVLCLENDLVEGAFTPERVEVLTLLAAQAAISLENASLYEELEARVVERTQALAEANRSLKQSLDQLHSAQKQLGEASRRAGMAEIATSVLHNIGNVLNSVNVSSRIVIESIRESKASGVAKVAQLLAEQRDLPSFFANDERARKLPDYLAVLARTIEGEQAACLGELESLQKNIDHIKVIVSMQQKHAKFGGVIESLTLAELMEDAIRLNSAANDRCAVEVIRQFEDLPPVDTDRHKLFQIVMNLLSNARHAVQDNKEHERRITVRIRKLDQIWVSIEVEDCGSGISPENLVKIFSLGFTTKKEGHGFGLHSSSCSAIEMGGTLTAHGDGPGKGALFTLRLPLLDPRAADADRAR